MKGPLKLAENCLKIGSGATPRGGKDAYLASGPYSLIRSQNVHNDAFYKDGLAFISEEQAHDLRNVEVLSGDVLLNITGDSVARACQVDADVLPARVNQHVAIIRPDPKKIDPRFLRYFLVAPQTQEFMLGLASAGATRNALTKSMIEGFELPPIDIQTQRSIGASLGVLDDKIELNRRMNQTLEAMARAIFHDWFVDFGPVRRKLAGATDPVAIMGGLMPDPARAAELAVLFPDGFGEDELPVGWRVSSVYKHARVIYGAPFGSGRFNTTGIGRPLIRIRDLPNNYTGIFTDEVNRKEHVIQPGDIVVGMDGEFRARLWHGVPSLMNQRVCSFVPLEPDRRSFVLESIRPLLDTLEQTAIGTTVIHLGKKDIDRFSLIDPREDLLAAYGQIAEPLLSRVVAAGTENRTLAETRDYLLPRLMSGEVRVTEAA